MKYEKFRGSVPKGFDERKCPAFDLELPTEEGFENAEHKLLIVIEHVDSGDIYSGKLLGNPVCKGLYHNLYVEAKKYASKLGYSKNTKLAFVNFNFFKTYNLQGDQLEQSIVLSVKRVKKYIKKVSPHTVLIFGDGAALRIAGIEKRYRGWVTGKKIKYISTLSLKHMYVSADKFSDSAEESSLLAKAIAHSNLLGYVMRGYATALLGEMPYSLKHIFPKVITVDTLSKFKKLMKKLDDSDVIAVDLETESLAVLDNPIQTIQFAVSEERGYFLPLFHKDSPFNSRDIKYVCDELRRFFSQKLSGIKRYLIGHNIKFDLRVIRKNFSIPFIYWPVFDTIAGEHALDENLKVLKSYGTKAWGLAPTMCRYENDFYYTAEFSKDDRATISDVPLTKALKDYSVFDVQSVWALHKMQIRRASDMMYVHKGKTVNYSKYYKRFILYQMSSTVHVMSEMESRGIQMDVKELMVLMSKDSKISVAIREAKKELYNSKTVKIANKLLLRKKGAPSKGLFGSVSTWIFDIGKAQHQAVLFFTVLKLKPLKTGKSGEASTDKYFQEEYKDVPEVALFSTIVKINKLKSTYVTAFYKRMSQDPDASTDKRMRPGYGYQEVVTGRSNSFGPSLQQIPQHSKEAKYIKRMFIAMEGHLIVKVDYAAHEVRTWSLISFDKALAKVFHTSKAYLNKFRLFPTKENKDDVKIKADVHKINYNIFTGIAIDKITDELRRIAKALTFGAIYGMSSYTLAGNLNETHKKTLKILARFFGAFKEASAWLTNIKAFAKKNLYVCSPIGRRRNLFGYIAPVSAIHAGQDRRSANSPIQGIASDFGFLAARLYMQKMYEILGKKGMIDEYDWWSPAGINVMVHDSQEVEARYDVLLLSLRCLEYCAVKEVETKVAKCFGMEFVVPLAIDFDIGASGDTMESWDFSEKSLEEIIKKALVVQRDAIGYKLDVDKAYAEIVKGGKKFAKIMREELPLDLEIDYELLGEK